MNLFHETESKYYELLTWLVNEKQSFTSQELEDLAYVFFDGEIDYEVWDVLFSKDEDNEILFHYREDKYYSIPDKEIPIRNTCIENQALMNIINNKYIGSFLQETTVDKLRSIIKDSNIDWDDSCIKIKRRSQRIVSNNNLYSGTIIRQIMKAIREEKGIVYNSILLNGRTYNDVLVYPVKIEYSFQNDSFRVSAYEPIEKRFIRVNLSTMKEIDVSDKTMKGLHEKYKKFLSENTKKIVLKLEPTSYIVERCFRLFSYYNRRAIYNVEDNLYKLEIEYLKFDEGEIIRNILSFGDSVIVIMPEDIRAIVYNRIKKAYDLYVE